MDFITFNPGPSQLSPKIIAAVGEIAESGFLSRSHRSKEFSDVSKQAIEGLRLRMGIPADFRIYYQNSATAAMDTLLRNLVFKKSFHFVNGTFSKSFYLTALGIGLESSVLESPLDKPFAWQTASIPDDTELVALTHNETSTGMMWPDDELKAVVAQHFPNKLIAIDMTSTFGGVEMAWEIGDIFFGSVQKCLGLPSGLGFLIVSPRAFEKAKDVLEKKKGVPPFQRFDILEEKMSGLYQTHETPNMLDIALLARQMTEWDLKAIAKKTKEKAKQIYSSLPWKPYVADEKWRSITLANFEAGDSKACHELAAKQHIILGQGYGPLKPFCVRIANFPAITDDHLRKLFSCFKRT